MQCPRCNNTSLDERDREGVTIDVCTGCRGVWLDRGELEKLIARTTADFEEYDRRPPRYAEPGKHAQPSQHSRDDDDDYRRRHPRKKSFMESLGDIFD